MVSFVDEHHQKSSEISSELLPIDKFTEKVNIELAEAKSKLSGTEKTSKQKKKEEKKTFPRHIQGIITHSNLLLQYYSDSAKSNGSIFIIFGRKSLKS